MLIVIVLFMLYSICWTSISKHSYINYLSIVEDDPEFGLYDTVMANVTYMGAPFLQIRCGYYNEKYTEEFYIHWFKPSEYGGVSQTGISTSTGESLLTCT